MDRKEKFIKDSLKDHQSDLDIKGLWTDVEAGLDQQERKRRGLWWFLLPLILIVSFGTYFFIQETDHANDTHQQVPLNKSTADQYLVTTKEADAVDLHKHAVDIEKRNLASDNEKVNLENEMKNPSEQKTENISKISVAKNQARKSNNARTQISKLEREGILRSSANKMSAQTDLLSTTQTLNKKQVEVRKEINNLSTNSLVNENNSEIQKVIIAPLAIDESRDPLYTDFTLLNSVSLKQLDIDFNEKFEREYLIAKENPWALAFNAGTSLVGSEYFGTGTTDFSQLISQREKSESYSMGQFFSLGVNYTLPIQNLVSTRHRLSFTSGLSLYQSNYIFEGEETIVDTDIIQGTSKVINNANGTTTVIIGDVIQTSTSTRRARNVNQVNILQVPLQLTYKCKLNRKFTFAFSNGLGYNVVNSISGKSYQESNGNLVIGDIKESTSPNRNYFTYIGGIGLELKLAKKWSLKGDLSYSHPLSQVSIEEGLKTSLTTGSASIGLQYHF